MSLRHTYHVVFAALFMALAASCSNKVKSKDGIDWSVTLNHEKRTPYGTSIAYETLPQYFPAARRESLTKWFRYTSINERMYGDLDSAHLLVLLGLDCYLTDEEWVSLLKFTKAGNEIFLLSSNIDVHLMEALHLSKAGAGYEMRPLDRYNDGSFSKSILQLVPDSNRRYGYYGRSVGAYFIPEHDLHNDTLDKENRTEEVELERKELESFIDTSVTVLGQAQRMPDFIRYRVGDGHITLHAAPLVLSNYFLLQKGNRPYLDSIWHSFPSNISRVYWNEYFKRSTQTSSLAVLLKYPATRWALIIASLTLLLYVLFGLKRLQRVVPIVPPVENSSVSFIETVGQLYFNKGQHANLAEKMVQHFLEWVRNTYYIDTSQLNETFNRQLSAKSGKPEEEVARLVQRIHDLRLGASVTPEYLYEFHHLLQSFYTAH
jgi:hypothetical protein